MISLIRLIRWSRLFLASRRLFRNWLWAGIEYFLAGRGLIYVGGIAVVCYDGFRDTVPVDIYQYLLYDNYLGIVEQYLCREWAIRYVNGMIISAKEYSEYGRELFIAMAVGSGWSYDKERDCWFKGNVELRSILGTSGLLGV